MAESVWDYPRPPCIERVADWRREKQVGEVSERVAERRREKQVGDVSEPSARTVRIEFAGEIIAESSDALRVLETASPPTIYLPVRDVRMELLRPARGKHTLCEWKGHARYLNLVVGDKTSKAAAFFYPNPRDAFSQLRDHVSFYPGRVDAAFIGDERVRPQPGKFYAGWITDEIEGPFKGEAGTLGW